MAFDETGQKVNWRNFWLCFMLCFGQFGFGYPSSIISTTLANPNFLVYMGLYTPAGVPTARYAALTGTTNGVYQAGAFVNVFLSAWATERWGRRGAMYYNAAWGILGGTLIAASQNIGMFIVGRFFAGGSAWGFLTLTPVYTSELCPPATRGFFVGMNGVCITLGYGLAVYMGLAFSYSSNPTAQWRAPLGIYLFVPLMLIAIAYFAPESPRWLLLKGRKEEARDITLKLHRVGKSFEFAKEEYHQMEKQIEIDRTLPVSWLQMFTNKSYRKRTALALYYCFLGQSTGILVLNNYGPSFYAQLGYGLTKQLQFQAGWITIAPPFCFLGAVLMDRVGRKPLMITGVGGCCICVILLAAATANAVPILGVAGLYMFVAVYSVGVDVGGNVFYAEAFPNHVRARGVALANAMLALSDLLYLECTPIAQQSIGWKWFLLFIIVSGLGAISLYFVLPETKGVPLEEMARIFNDTDVAIYSENVPTYEKDAVEKA